jgi:hypothetical protein
MASPSTEALLGGAFDITELREPPAKVVRVYLCSAGTGMYEIFKLYENLV